MREFEIVPTPRCDGISVAERCCSYDILAADLLFNQRCL